MPALATVPVPPLPPPLPIVTVALPPKDDPITPFFNTPNPKPNGECNPTGELELEDPVVGEDGGLIIPTLLLCDDNE